AELAGVAAERRDLHKPVRRLRPGRGRAEEHRRDGREQDRSNAHRSLTREVAQLQACRIQNCRAAELQDCCPAILQGLDQKTNLNPICTWREVVAVCVICVALAERVPSGLNSPPVPGVAKLARLKRLKISARNWKFWPLIRKFLKNDISTTRRSG